ncbi:M20 family metallopeptidase [Opitutus terrae]|uniref:Peptidase M20 n=1 Tax=Opitutus terrae (strain DSM 11246 / JCM 15787 / PB90-1) TaxID=452637 RepID=B1ZY50_OPITP|nr:M20 family metallopeptidase [Opitutus terrae]ACB76199.1 peptidase M20 [Opitutus terrae PB90-1]
MNPSAALPESCEQLLAQMVAFDTVNARYAGRASGEPALAAHLEAIATAWGFTCRRLPVTDGLFNLLIQHEPVPGGEWLLFESHLDTVSAAGMTVPPFAVSSDATRLFGRGVCDTKGSGAAMLWALRSLRSEPSLRRNIGVLFTVDEEAGMTGAGTFARATLPQWPGPLLGIIVGEPTELQPVIAHNGLVRWTTVTRGRAAHSADPAQGRSAISAMVRVIEALESQYVPGVATRIDPLTGAAACSINVIRGGTQVNIVPERCEIDVDRRLVPGESPAEALAARDRVLAPLARGSAPVEFEHLPLFGIPPLSSEPNLPLLRRFAPVLTRHGSDATARGVRYATNASHYATASVPVIVLGPGSITQAHTADEWLSRDQLDRATRLYAALMTG